VTMHRLTAQLLINIALVLIVATVISVWKP
jgi:hypothetical protein